MSVLHSHRTGSLLSARRVPLAAIADEQKFEAEPLFVPFWIRLIPDLCQFIPTNVHVIRSFLRIRMALVLAAAARNQVVKCFLNLLCCLLIWRPDIDLVYRQGFMHPGSIGVVVAAEILFRRQAPDLHND